MYEDTQFATEKLAACIFAALRMQTNEDPTVLRAWSEIRSVIGEIIHRSFANYEHSVIKQVIRLRPKQLLQLKKGLERQQIAADKRREWEQMKIDRWRRLDVTRRHG